MLNKASYFSGVASVLFIMAGSMMKIQHWPGAGIMLVLGFFTILFVFLPVALIQCWNQSEKKSGKLLYFVTYLTALVVYTGALFKIMHWPGAGTFLWIAMPFPFVVFLPVYLYSTSKLENFDIHKTVFVLFFIAYVAVMSALLALNVSKNVLDGTVDIARTSEKMNTSLKKLGTKNMSHAGNDVIAVLAKCRSVLYETTEGNPAMGVKGFRHLDSRNIALDALMKTSDKNQSFASDLYNSLIVFRETLIKSNADPAYAKLVNKMLFLDSSGNYYEWEVHTIQDRFLSWMVVYFQDLENNVYLLSNI